MRGIVLTAIIFGVLPFVFRWPVLGAYLWAWVSMMSPQKLTFGFAFDLPFAQAIAGVTLLAFIGTRKRRAIPITLVTRIWLLLLLWMTVTSFFALNRGDLVLDRWIFVFKIQLMLAVSLMLVTEERHFKWLVWVVTLSVVFFGVKGGIYTITGGGGGRVWGPPGGLLQGNNELATALVMLVPYLYWMRETISNKFARLGLLVAMALCVASILGSQSRGALLAVLAMALMLGLKSRYKLRTTLVLVLGLAAAIAWMPTSWTKRMDTIQAYQTDNSAMSRLYAWSTMWNAAVDRPLVGTGFRADSRVVYERYAPHGEQWTPFAGVLLVAHSIYFEMLGEHGFVGLFLYIALWIAVWISAGRTARQAEALPNLASWLPLLMRMTQVSVLGFLVGGAFLSLAYLDLTYYLMGYVLLAEAFVRRASRQAPNLAIPSIRTLKAKPGGWPQQQRQER